MLIFLHKNDHYSLKYLNIEEMLKPEILPPQSPQSHTDK